MCAPRRKPGFRRWKRVAGIVQRMRRTPTEWRKIPARLRSSGQSRTKFCEQNGQRAARSSCGSIGWLASGDDGRTSKCATEWFVEVEDDGNEVPPPHGSGVFAEVTEAGALVTDPDRRRPLEDGRGWPRLPELRARQSGEGEWELEVGLMTTGRIVMRMQGGWRC